MRILFLLSRIEKSGVALHTIDLLEGLASEGHELHLVTGGITDIDSPYLLELKNKIDGLGVAVKTFKTPSGNFLRKAVTGLRSTVRILRWIVRIRADVIHAQSPYMTFLPWLLGKQYVTTVHNVQLVKNLKYKNPTRLIAISLESREYAIKSLGARPETISVVHHGISDRFSLRIPAMEKEALRKRLGISSSEVVLGFVGRITRDKGLDVLIRAVEEELEVALRKRIHYIFLGDYYSEEDRLWLEQLIAEFHIGDKTSKLPFQDPMPFYQIFDIFVLPSKSEAFGLVCVEAMMSGCCTVRTDTNGATDQIADGEDGYIFPNGDAGALAHILTTLMKDPELVRKIRQKGREKALANFTLRAMTGKTLDVYKKITA